MSLFSFPLLKEGLCCQSDLSTASHDLHHTLNIEAVLKSHIRNIPNISLRELIFLL